MSNSMFASIYIGSYEVNMKIFEFDTKKKIHEVEFIQSRLDLGRSAFSKGLIDYEQVDDLCLILNEFKQIIAGYRIENYSLYSSAIFEEINNKLFVIDQIRLRTGMKVNVIGNAEHRFLTYKAVAGRETFEKLIRTSAAFIDIGGASVQFTFFRGGALSTTQHLDIGAMRLSELLYRPGLTQSRYEMELEQYINKKLELIRAMYMQEAIENVIIASDYGIQMIRGLEKDFTKQKDLFKAEKIQKYIEKLLEKPLEEITEELNLSEDNDPLIIPALSLFHQIIALTGAGEAWFPGVDINDGIAYDYAQKKRLIAQSHDFDADVLSAARFVSDHYKSFSQHIEALNAVSCQIFDSLKKIHGLGKRERLLLQVATMLHDCGKYVSINHAPECAYQIISSTEIIGLSRKEREMIGLVVYYNTMALDDYEDLADQVTKEEYVTIAKLSAILRVANALDQSHKQKFKSMRITYKEHQLVITVEALEDISLEQQLFDSKTAYFENVFSIKPVLKTKRIYKVEK